MNLPSDEEVALAKLAHFYEMVRQSGANATAKEVVIAKGLLKELGDIGEPTEELTQMVAKLYSLAMGSMNASLEKAAKEKALVDEEGAAPRGGRDESSRDSDRSRAPSRGDGYREDRDRRGSDSRGGNGGGRGGSRGNSRGGGGGGGRR